MVTHWLFWYADRDGSRSAANNALSSAAPVVDQINELGPVRDPAVHIDRSDMK